MSGLLTSMKKKPIAKMLDIETPFYAIYAPHLFKVYLTFNIPVILGPAWYVRHWHGLG